eukprot:10184743-Alexandrium_andersonii.AAC.1
MSVLALSTGSEIEGLLSPMSVTSRFTPSQNKGGGHVPVSAAIINGARKSASTLFVQASSCASN